MALTESEERALIALMGKMEFPVSQQVFEALCGTFVTNPIELAVLRVQNSHQEVLLIYREDSFYRGWHLPGSIHLPGDNVDQVIQRIADREVGQAISTPEFIGYVETSKEENPRGQELSLLFISYLEGSGNPNGKFFPLENLPTDTLRQHQKLLKMVVEYLEVG